MAVKNEKKRVVTKETIQIKKQSTSSKKNDAWISYIQKAIFIKKAYDKNDITRFSDSLSSTQLKYNWLLNSLG